MDRCPVCQAPARAGARFCTTCGYRLPDEVATPPATGSDPGPTPEAVAGAGADDGWPVPSAPAAGEPEGIAWDAATDVDATSTPGDGGPADWTAPQPAADALQAAPIWPTPEARGAEDSVVSWGAPILVAEPASAGEPAPADAPADGGEPVADTPSDEGEDTSPTAVEPHLEGDEGDRSDPAPPPPMPAPAWGFATDADQDPLPVRPRPRPAPSENEAREQLLTLLDEARALAPLVGGPAFDAAGIAADLDAALEDPADGRAALLAAIDDARANPSDVGVILVLSRHVEDIVALADAHEHLTAAARRAAAMLRGERPDAIAD